MDFHKALEDSLNRFSGVQGIVFVDPDGEAIVFKVDDLGDYELRLAGANMSILTRTIDPSPALQAPKVVELQCAHQTFLFVRLVQDYSITAVCSDLKDKFRLKRHLLSLSSKFNQEIL